MNTASKGASVSEKDFECSICIEPWTKAVTLVPCGHTFCEACLFPDGRFSKRGAGKRKYHEFENCPECRTPITSFFTNFRIQAITDGLVAGGGTVAALPTPHRTETPENPQQVTTPVSTRGSNSVAEVSPEFAASAKKLLENHDSRPVPEPVLKHFTQHPPSREAVKIEEF